MIQIVPTLAPLVSGVGDYALLLAMELRRACGLHTHFLVGNPDWQGAAELHGFAVSRLANRNANALTAMLRETANDDSSVLLHYAGYGYEKRGCPVWLVNGLRDWRQGSQKARLVTMFHELFASGPPWRSSFWLSSLQKHLVTRLARLSDACLTSLNDYARQLVMMEPDCQSRLLHAPVFSNFGEPQTLKPLRERPRRMVVIGHHGRRALMYERSGGQLQRICERFAIDEMLDIGEPVGFDIAAKVDVPITVCGVQSAAAISDLLQNTIVGIFDYPGSMLGKSTVFAAYAAHRVIPIVVAYDDARPADDLEPEKHYWVSDIEPERLNLAAGQRLADNAYDWYQSHNLATQGRTFAACLSGKRQANNGHYSRRKN